MGFQDLMTLGIDLVLLLLVLHSLDRDAMAGVDAGIDIEVDVEDEVEDVVESSDREQVEEGLQDIYENVMEIPLQRIADIETRRRGLEARSLIAGEERASLLEMRFRILEKFTARHLEAIEELVTDEWKKRWLLMRRPVLQIALEAEIQSQNGSDDDNGNGGDRNGGDGNGRNGNGEYGNPMRILGVLGVTPLNWVATE
uniref:Uncharacterized protein n=1 Tax=Tanacetum cinerariifolium TaxID=118510 RepID=A0A6L2NWP1_TANCI|nr:hypothetical protein [Tanacetum cinerariifolium]